MSGARADWLVLVHGFLGEPPDWDPVIAELSRQGTCRAVAIDLLECAMRPGVGAALERAVAGSDAAPGSGAAGGSSAVPGSGAQRDGLDVLADAMCAEVERALAAHGADATQAALCGYSLGGRAVLAAAGGPARAWSGPLVLMGADPGIDDPSERPARTARDDAHAMHLQESPDPFLRAWYAQPLFASLRARPDFDDVLARRRARLADPLVRQAWARVLRACSPGRCMSRRNLAASLGSRATFIHGALDDKFSALARHLSARAPLLPTISVPAAGHAAHVEQPVSCAQALAECLLAHDRRRREQP